MEINDVAKHAIGRFPGPILPVPSPGIGDLIRRSFEPRTAFDGDDFSPFDPSFDIDGGAARIVEKYDRNGDGAIDLGAGSELGELLRRETSRRDGDASHSIAKLAKYADEAGNRDGSATVEEIADVIRKFDQGAEGDGRLSGQERETFLEVFGEDTTLVRKRRPMLPPAPKPVPMPMPMPMPPIGFPPLSPVMPYVHQH